MTCTAFTSRRTITSSAIALAAIAAALGAPAAQAGWSAPQTLVRPPLFDAFRIDAAANADGFAAFAWFHTTHTMRRDPHGRSGYLRHVRARMRRADGGLTRVQTVSRTGVIVDGPRVGVDRRGTTTVAWQEFRRARRHPFVMVAVTRKGARFGAPVQLGRGSASPGMPELPAPSLAVAPDGRAVLAWNDGRRIVAVLRPAGRCASRRGRACFGSAKVLSGAAARPYHGPVAAIGTTGTASVTWSDGKGALRVASARRGRPFGPSQRVSPAGEPASAPALAVGDDGSTVIAWRRAPEDSGIERRYGPIMAATRDARGRISAAQPVDPGHAASPVAVRTNARGEAILLWIRRLESADEVVAAVRPPGGGFGAPALIATSASRGDGPLAYRYAQLAVDGRGRAIVAFGRSAVVRPAGGGFGPPAPIPGSRQLIPTGSAVTTLWIDGGAARLSDLS